jgi:integrase
MATMSTHKTKIGEARYKFEIRLKKDGTIIHQESKTFSSKTVGKDWAKKRESELEKHGAIEAHKHKGITVKQVMDGLLAATECKFGRSRNCSLKFMMGQDIAEIDIVSLKPHNIIKHCEQRSTQGTNGATILQDISAIKSALKYAKAALGLPVTVTIIDEASEYLSDNRIIHKSKKRNRRPTYDELKKLDEFFANREKARKQTFSMRLVMWFAIYSCRRQDEIATLLRSDIDWEHQFYIVRDMKSPTGSTDNHKTAHMPQAGWAVLKAMVARIKTDNDFLLPVSSSSVSASFTRACHVLGIDDLRFHDLRHEGASRLAEDGSTIPQIQQVTLHDSWSSLQIYVNMTSRRGQRLDYIVTS